MKSMYQNLSLICFCVLFYSCSFNSEPDISLGKDAVKNLISKQSKIQMTLSNFTKSNGIKREIMGQAVYTMEFTGQIRVEQKCWQRGLGHLLIDFDFLETLPQYNNAYYVGMSKTIFYKGALLNCVGKINFEKTEQGWRETDCTISSLDVISNEEPIPTEFTAIGTIESLDFYKEISVGILIATSDDAKIQVSYSSNFGNDGGEYIYVDNKKLLSISDIKVGMKIGINGKWVESDEKKYLQAERIDILK